MDFRNPCRMCLGRPSLDPDTAFAIRDLFPAQHVLWFSNRVFVDIGTRQRRHPFLICIANNTPYPSQHFPLHLFPFAMFDFASGCKAPPCGDAPFHQ